MDADGNNSKSEKLQNFHLGFWNHKVFVEKLSIAEWGMKEKKRGCQLMEKGKPT